VASLLPGVAVELVVVETEGDRRVDVPLESLGGQGVFAKEVQTAVLRGDADAAVHSAKDLPASADLTVADLVIAAYPERADPRDLLVGGTVGGLAAGDVVATGSPRRRVQLARARPDLAFTGLRGNLSTRLARAGQGGVAAVVVAKAAVDRLGWRPGAGVATEVLEPSVMVPQVGQGALAVECRRDDGATREVLAHLDRPEVRRALTAERAFLAELGGGCLLPVGAHARDAGPGDGPGGLVLVGLLADDDGREVHRHEATGADPERLGREVARYLLGAVGEVGDGPTGDGVGAPAGP
jgi:hydroxymethylbilane synthase